MMDFDFLQIEPKTLVELCAEFKSLDKIRASDSALYVSDLDKHPADAYKLLCFFATLGMVSFLGPDMLPDDKKEAYKVYNAPVGFIMTPRFDSGIAEMMLAIAKKVTSDSTEKKISHHPV